MLVLAVFAGLAYLQYRRGGNSWTAPWSKGPAQTPVQASQTQPGDQANAGQNAAQGPNASAAPAVPNSGTNQPPNAQDTTSADGSLKEKDLPPQGGASTGPEAAGTQGAAAGSAAAGTGAQGGAPSESPADAAAKDEKTSKSGSNEETAETAPAAPGAKNAADAGKSASAKESGSAAAKDTEEDTTEAADVPVKPAKGARTKPSPQVAPASPDESLVTNAEKYLYGRGVPQNCDRALISLKAAANRQNARAQTLLGTMYFTGHCVSKDLPNSYRWFAQASRQSPDNMLVQRNLEMIWRTMTPQERQLATARQ
jgi:TPR repeat protein